MLRGLLSHVHFGPTSLEMNFIHQRSHQVDATAMRGLKLFCRGRVREFGAVESLSFVSHHNGDLLIGRTSADDVNMLVRVFVIAVNDSVCQGFSQGDFNVNFAAGHTSASLDEQHELIYKRRDCSDCTSNGRLYPEYGAARVRNTRQGFHGVPFGHFS